ncbi:MAG: hypothetical protein NE330_20520 [Lentisphaeraceae bacterium]|nr:hypothetical protein [Lentisphaeraceae bacterium]
MKKLITILCLLIAPVLLAEEKKEEQKITSEQLFVDALLLTENLAKILETAKDDESSKQAALKINAMVPRAQVISQKAKKLGMNNLSKEERASLTEKYRDRMMKATGKIIQLTNSLKGNKAVAAAMMAIKKAMQ